MNKRQRKKAAKKRAMRWQLESPTGIAKSAPALQNFPINGPVIIIDSATEFWEQVLWQMFGHLVRKSRVDGAIDVTYEHITLDQPERPLVPGGSDDRRRRLLAAGPEPPAGGTQPVDDADVHGRGSEKETD